jgi:hypothetical protein
LLEIFSEKIAQLQTIAPISLLKVKLRILIVSPSNSNCKEISVNTSKNVPGIISIIIGIVI